MLININILIKIFLYALDSRFHLPFPQGCYYRTLHMGIILLHPHLQKLIWAPMSMAEMMKRKQKNI